MKGLDLTRKAFTSLVTKDIRRKNFGNKYGKTSIQRSRIHRFPAYNAPQARSLDLVRLFLIIFHGYYAAGFRSFPDIVLFSPFFPPFFIEKGEGNGEKNEKTG